MPNLNIRLNGEFKYSERLFKKSPNPKTGEHEEFFLSTVHLPEQAAYIKVYSAECPLFDSNDVVEINTSIDLDKKTAFFSFPN
jgi:hypothetical protein